MLILGAAQYLGTNQTYLNTNGVYISLTHYTQENLQNNSLHAHANPHLTLLLQGGTTEERGKYCYERKAGDIVFFSAAEPHCNRNTLPDSKNLNFEFEPGFFEKYEINECSIGSAASQMPNVKFLLLKAYKELMLGDPLSGESIDMLLLYLIHTSKQLDKKNQKNINAPGWVRKVQECLHDKWNETVTLKELSLVAGVHPVTISKHFPVYFSCTLGEYIRNLKIERSLSLIKSSKLSLLEISYECGFADQSHFTRTFKLITGFLPNDFRKL
jgi:AraC family transcriptional regulator